MKITGSALEYAAVDLWIARPSDYYSGLDSVLPLEEVRRLDRFRSNDERERRIVTWALTRRVIGLKLDMDPNSLSIRRWCRICKSADHGKPCKIGDLHFSVSHSANRVAVAVTNAGPVGADIERVSEVSGIERFVLHPDEVPPEQELDLLRYWVRKEAVLKATGMGLSVSMNSLKVSAPNAVPSVLEYPGRDFSLSDSSLHDVNVGHGYLASVAVLRSSTYVVLHDGSSLIASSEP
jgi:4'-phosphopantetheinyl transferase